MKNLFWLVGEPKSVIVMDYFSSKGVDTKIMKNCGKVKLKKTKLDIMMNYLVATVSI